MLRRVLVLLALLAVVSDARTRRHYHPTNRDHDPEENMTTPEIIAHWGYQSQSIQVTTKDNYILTMHRIPSGKTVPSTKGVIFMQHGLLGSSSNWVTNLPNLAFGFMAADAGYDVWLGNVRGNDYSLGHTTLNATNTSYWQWSWDEMVKYDLDAMIDKVLAETGQKDLYYVGHSQGTLIMFSKLASDADFNMKIRKFFALAPVGVVGNIQGLLHILGNDLFVEAELLLKLLGPGAFLPDTDFIHGFSEFFCQNSLNDQLCDNVLFMIGGPDSKQMNESRTDVFLCDMPAGTSTINILHWLQMVKSNKQQMYDYGDVLSNLAHYGTPSPPEYDITKIKAETHLYYSDTDWLGDKVDVEAHLVPNIPKTALKEVVEMNDFEHFDFVWGSRGAEEIYTPILKTIDADVAARRAGVKP